MVPGLLLYRIPQTQRIIATMVINNLETNRTDSVNNNQKLVTQLVGGEYLHANQNVAS